MEEYNNSLHNCIQPKIFIFQAEVKQRVEEYKQQKKDEDEIRNLEEQLWERVQKEQQREIAAKELVKFRERVILCKTSSFLINVLS